MNFKEVDAFYSTVVDRIVDMVWKRFPEDEKARLATYDRLAESFAGLVKVFSGPEGKRFEVPPEPTEEETSNVE